MRVINDRSRQLPVLLFPPPHLPCPWHMRRQAGMFQEEESAATRRNASHNMATVLAHL